MATAIIVTQYDGATAADIETKITKPLEDEIRGVSGLKDVKSTSQAGLSTIVVRIDMDDSKVDVDEAIRLVEACKGALEEEDDAGFDPSFETDDKYSKIFREIRNMLNAAKQATNDPKVEYSAIEERILRMGLATKEMLNDTLDEYVDHNVLQLNAPRTVVRLVELV